MAVNDAAVGYDIGETIDVSDVTKGKYLTFWTDSQLFGVQIANVEQIVGIQTITRIPEFPAYAKGIINLRGNVVPLIDVRLRLGRPETEYDDHTCIIVTKISNSMFGFIVDQVEEVSDIGDERISPPPKMSEDAQNRYLIGVARLENETDNTERIVLLLDTCKILGEDEIATMEKAI